MSSLLNFAGPASQPVSATQCGNLILFTKVLRPQMYLSPDNMIEEIELEKFKKSLQNFDKCIKSKRTKIIGKLKANRTSPQEEEWLDNHGNLIEETVIFQRFFHSNNDGKDVIKISCMEFEAIKRLVEHGNDIQRSNSFSQKRPLDDMKKKNAKKRAKPSHSHKNNRIATLSQKLEIINWNHQNGKNQRTEEENFNEIYPELCLKQPHISAWLKEEKTIHKNHQMTNSKDVKRVIPVKHAQVVEMLEE
ncbi:hypothetical protein O181_002626 [Austropuccinia psidii MF-1]|uniref:Uncharacterized protein n=1 Tax=Austropuccinia psidii MF-1 TaxID=1389203 RepID=A0A9Q3GDF1_9BASI|nr:hypothetical protein [Austropuccinia psidii MF-1]